MAGTVVQLKEMFNGVADGLAQEMGNLWEKWDNLREPKKAEWQEVRQFVFATDTSDTVVGELGWKNRTTIPKICNIRDNLHSNYISAIFPNDNWLRWEGDDFENDTLKRKSAIEGYMRTKVRQSNLRDTISGILYDYIDKGNCFAASKYVNEGSYDPVTTATIGGYKGPKGYRISPLDIVFDPTAADFYEAPKLIRSILTLGELVKLANKEKIWKDALDKTMGMRKNVATGNYRLADVKKALSFQIEGFGDLREYYGSDFVEVLTFEGDYLDREAMELHEDTQIIVIDRSILVTERKIPSPLGKRRIAHAGWRKRPDNLWAMGPLDNLVGMQYRIDHLENLKADAQDLSVHPPLVIEGDVDPFVWEPNAEIHIVGEGKVTELGMNLKGVAMANNEIAALEQRMEMYAGSPREAMGIRTPGEKTAFEVQALENAYGRIFQEKITNFEVNLLEPLLNSMLADAINGGLNGTETVRILDNELGVETFESLSKNDLQAEGKIYPIGARHFGQMAQMIQNINTALNGAMGQMIMPHISGKQLAAVFEDGMQIQKYGLVRPYVGLIEQAEGMQVQQAMMAEVQSNALTPTMEDETTPPRPEEDYSGVEEMSG